MQTTTSTSSSSSQSSWGASGSMQHKIVGEAEKLPGGITAISHIFKVPLRWSRCHGSATTDTRQIADGQEGKEKYIDVFARELVLTKNNANTNLPYLIYLQGGPGFPSPRVDGKSGWGGKALDEFRVILLDQRGTGRSTPITPYSLSKWSPQEQADYLTNFRADSIVEDCEVIRRRLAGHYKKWTVLGQSFGGFCLLTYLSKYPEAIEAGLFTGGIPPVNKTALQIYRATYKRLLNRNKRFYQAYPGDVERIHRIVSHLAAHKGVPLPAGGVLTPRRFLQIGLGLGGAGFFESLHYLVEDPFEDCHDDDNKDGECSSKIDGDGGGGGGGGGGDGSPKQRLKWSFLRAVEGMHAFDTNVIYAILHEAIYCQSGQSSDWAAQQAIEEAGVAELFDWEKALAEVKPIQFTGEMCYPWMFEGDYGKLTGLKQAADILASYKGWSQLYDVEALSKCPVPCAAAVYYDDMYVERQFSEETAELMPNMKLWITNEYQHSGLRNDGVNIFNKLLSMTRDEVTLPS